MTWGMDIAYFALAACAGCAMLDVMNVMPLELLACLNPLRTLRLDAVRFKLSRCSFTRHCEDYAYDGVPESF
ncbi:hypothetical protein K439DRAFT_1639299 [Ramaria rubella]|nr:hypothetical protein K439DRAFT_1639299 [Ramaria rubella]